MRKWVYQFGNGEAEGNADMKERLGGKGCNLAEMATLGLPVPPGFTITTDVCAHYYAQDQRYPEALEPMVSAAMQRVEAATGACFGDAGNPLLVSVRSGARVSMPGMMDTVLNLGLNDDTAAGLARRSGDARFAYDCYRRFIEMFGNVVLGIEQGSFAEILGQYKKTSGLGLDTDLTAQDWQTVIGAYKRTISAETGDAFPQDPNAQLWAAIGAVFRSWMNRRAVTYRKLYDIPDDWGTAVTVQAMVFGNMGDDCATGVAFTRNPATGENAFFGEYLVNAQGEDVVAGIRTPQHLTIVEKRANGSSLPAMEESMPAVFVELMAVRQKLERHCRDMQDIEFTVQAGKLYMLQTRSGKRTAAAALKIAVDMVAEWLISEQEAVARIEPGLLDQLLHPTLDPSAERCVVARGLPASPGAASGEIVLCADKAEALAAAGHSVILCRTETCPDDIHGMYAAKGILTARGGMTSHAAVVARGMGRPCVAGAGELAIDSDRGVIRVNNLVLREGDPITIDGCSGEVMQGAAPTITPELSRDFTTLMGWADKVRTMGIRANADTPGDARTAREFGAEGIGLCRTEHMFFEGDRITAMREMILADSERDRRRALDKILPMQRADFVEIFRIMKDLPVTIRLLDPPLNEFLPRGEAELTAVAGAAGIPLDELRMRALALEEANPMLGHRGCRLGITYPEIYEMQVRAIFEAVVEIAGEDGDAVEPEIMVPLVAVREELEILKSEIDRVAEEIRTASGVRFGYQVGVMIELPRAALRAGEIAGTAEFFSFGTNDLTQTVFGLSRDDSAGFLGAYEQRGILRQDPFITLDRDGVGELIDIACERGRATRPALKLGLCGEHGGDPASIRFCYRAGLDYVSCSPYRVPIARLAAAQAALLDPESAGDILAVAAQ